MTVQVEVDFRPKLGPVRDQGTRQTCLAHASSVAHEHSRGSGLTLSPEYLHFFAVTGRSSGGRTIDGLVNALKRAGQSTEADCPYLSSDPPKGWKPPGALRVFRCASEPKFPSAAEVERALKAGSIPVLGISLPEPFFLPSPPWIIPARGSLRGLHAVAAVGIAAHGSIKLILVRNSWGADWGDGGHAWLDFDFIGQHLKDLLVLTHEVTL